MSKDEFRGDLIHHKTMAELHFVVSLYANTDMYEEYKVEPMKVFSNQHWLIYYGILSAMIEKKKVSEIDQINIEMYISEQGEKLRAMYEKAGGWHTIEEAKQIIETENIDAYYREVLRYSAILKLHDSGFNIEKNWDKYSKLTYEELADAVTGSVDSIFAGIDMGEDKVEDMVDGMWEMLEEADKGSMRGLPVSSKLLNSVVNGQVAGNITMVAGASGAGKTYFSLCQTLPSAMRAKEPLLIMCNEEDKKKWQREIIAWQINNIQKKDLVKSRFYQGEFTADEWEMFRIARDWLNEMLANGLIQFVNFSTFSMNKSIKLIRKYATQKSIKYFIIDTLKLDNDVGSNVTELAWLQLQQNMVKLYNVIKPTAKNVHVWVTYQLNKSVRARFLDQSALGMSKNVADVVSTLILVRNALESEKGANGLKVKRADGQSVELSEEKEYMIAFIDKNRQGSTSSQIVWRVDKGRNIMKDVGFTKVSQDY